MTRERIRLRLGTRRSALALAQSGLVARALQELDSRLDVELVPIVTRGDTTPGSLAALGGKGLFTAELEAGLLDGSLDLAVHSLKDLPVKLPTGLVIAAHPPREDPRDALHLGARDDDRRTARRARASSPVRCDAERCSCAAAATSLIEDIRGNVDTRIRKWRETGAEGLVLAAAGLVRLGLASDGVSAHPQPADVMLPAPGQGILAIETRAASRAFEIAARSTIPPPRAPREPSATWSPPSVATARCRSPPGRASATALSLLGLHRVARRQPLRRDHGRRPRSGRGRRRRGRALDRRRRHGADRRASA